MSPLRKVIRQLTELEPNKFPIIQTISNLATLFFIETNLSGVFGVISIIVYANL